MAQYYLTRLSAPSHNKPSGGSNHVNNSEDTDETLPTLTDFDKHRETLLNDDQEEGWASELRRYLGTMQRDVTKDLDLVEWWQVNT
jgi:hypothetical protein